MVQILYMSLGVFFGLYSTYTLVAYCDVLPVIASSFMGLLAYSIVRFNKKHILLTAIYCGSFAGMNTILYQYELIVIGIVTSLLFILLKDMFHGYGGKLGFIAYISSVLSETLILIITCFSVQELSFINMSINEPILNYSILLVTLVSSMAGFYITIFLHHTLKCHAVVASAFPSFVVAIISLDLPYSVLIASTFFSASFLGMMTENKIHKKHYFFVVLLHCIITIFLNNNLSKYGGALGTIAFITAFIAIQSDVLVSCDTSLAKIMI